MYTRILIAALFKKAKILETTQRSCNRKMDEHNVQMHTKWMDNKKERQTQKSYTICFILYEVQEQLNVIYGDRNQVNGCLCKWAGDGVLGRWWVWMERDMTEVSRTMKMSYILIVAVVTRVHTFIKMYQIVQFKFHAFYWQY